MTRSGAVAAIDCGTNSTRLLVVDRWGAPLTRRMRITRLGQGVAATGRLAPEAVERTVATLLGYRRVMDDLGVQRVRITATSAARDASNRHEFFDAAEASVGFVPELLTGDEEGQLSFIGATAEVDQSLAPFLVADIGGGSTELAAGPSPDPAAGRFSLSGVRSLDMGCVRITETYLAADPPEPAELAAAREAVASLVRGAISEVPALGAPATLIGLAGTVSALTRLHQSLEVYDRNAVHHAWLERSSVDALLAELAAVPVDDRRHRVGMEPERADVIVGGAVVLAELMAQVGAARCLVSESDILDGLAMSLLVDSAGY